MKRTVLLCLLITLLYVLLFSCKNDETGVSGNNNTSGTDSLKDLTVNAPGYGISFISPQNSSKYRLGDTVSFEVAVPDSTASPDSICLMIDGKRVARFNDSSRETVWRSEGKVGRRNFRAIAWKEGKSIAAGGFLFLKSDIVPRAIGYKLIRSYPHDKGAYTQGLVYEAGVLYEGTGQYYESSLRKVNIETGEVLQNYNLPEEVFGEGIVIDGNRIIQITWRSQIAYVFDKQTFKLLNTYEFQTQGWGITFYPDWLSASGKNADKTPLLLSDGTAILYVIDPELFTRLDKIEVYDDYGPVENLNELEYISGYVYANVYQTTKIVEIEPATGRVTGILDMTAIVPDEYKNDRGEDVLNGIAYNPENKHLYVTGKRWPKMFEIILTE